MGRLCSGGVVFSKLRVVNTASAMLRAVSTKKPGVRLHCFSYMYISILELNISMVLKIIVFIVLF